MRITERRLRSIIRSVIKEQRLNEMHHLAGFAAMKGSGGGRRVVCASRIITASCAVLSAGRAGKRTWVGQRRTGLGAMR